MGKWKTDLDVAMKTWNFYGAERIAILPFLQTIERECDVVRITKAADIWSITLFVKDPTRATIQISMDREGTQQPVRRCIFR